jgi:hypothetical protein
MYSYRQWHTFYYLVYLTQLYRLAKRQLVGLAAVNASRLSKDFNTPYHPRQWSSAKGYNQLIKGHGKQLQVN